MGRSGGGSQMRLLPLGVMLLIGFTAFYYIEFVLLEEEPSAHSDHGSHHTGLHEHVETEPDGTLVTKQVSPIGYQGKGASRMLDIFADEDDSVDDIDESELSDSFTVIMGAVNINRTGHLGHSGPHQFEDDYLANLKRWANFFAPETPIRLRFQKKYVDYMASTMELSNVEVKHLELDDLRNFKYYNDIERIRTSPWWLKATSWLSGVPQGWSPYYNPLVMQKVFMLYELAKENPFKTKYFVWLDAGGICTPNLERFGKENFFHKLKHFMDGFLITRSDYAGSNEIHGCQRRLMVKLTANHPAYVSKGWLMAGSRKTIGRVVRAYDKVLAKTLSMGCLGTEETVFTIMAHTHPHLFHPYYNQDRDWVFNGLGFCAFLEPSHKWEVPDEEYEEEWVHEQLLKEKEKAGA